MKFSECPSSPPLAAYHYIDLECTPLPLPPRRKACLLKGWSKLRIKKSDVDGLFKSNSNVGLLLGAASKGLADVDIDDKRGLKIAHLFLPSTVTFGRISSPVSHWLYRANGAKPETFKDPDGSMLVELRAEGQQTVSPPSLHEETGEKIEYGQASGGTLTEVVASDLRESVARFAGAILVGKHWPKPGSRQSAAMAIVGALTRDGWSTQEIKAFVGAVTMVADDEEGEKRVDIVDSAADRLRDGGQLYGWTKCGDFFSSSVIDLCREWLSTSNDTKNSVHAGAQSDYRRVIKLSNNLVPIVDSAINALIDRGDVFQRGGQLVRVRQEHYKIVGEARPGIRRHVEAIPEASVNEMLSESLVCERVTANARKPAPFPRDALKALVARGSWAPMRVLHGVVDTPVLKPGGDVISRAGYDDETGLMYHPHAPTTFDETTANYEAALTARDLLLNLVDDFPFANDTHRAAYLAAVLTPFARYSYKGCTPLVLVEANVQGTGKSLLVDVVSLIAQGEPAARAVFTPNEDEMRKRITSVAIQGERMPFLDNASGKLGGQPLEAALTSSIWTDRRLGFNESVRTPVHWTWFVTANNLELTSDMTRRTLLIRLESPLERPDERVGFLIPDLIDFTARNRWALAKAALTILVAYRNAGSPEQRTKSWGSFEGWGRAVVSPVMWVFGVDPGRTRDELRQRADSDLELGRRLIRMLNLSNPKASGVTVAEILKQSKAHSGELEDLLRESVGDVDAHNTAIRLGKLLNKYLGRNIDGQWISKLGTTNGSARWGLKAADINTAYNEGAE